MLAATGRQQGARDGLADTRLPSDLSTTSHTPSLSTAAFDDALTACALPVVVVVVLLLLLLQDICANGQHGPEGF